MSLFILEGSRLTSEAEFWREYLNVVRPDGAEYFGRNIAAFRDAITAGGPGWPGESCVLRIVDHKTALVGDDFLLRVAAVMEEVSGNSLELH